MTLSDKRKDTYTVEDLKEGLYRGIDIKDSIKKLKEELVCDFCKKHPDYNGMCSGCFNAGIIINQIFGRRLSEEE